MSAVGGHAHVVHAADPIDTVDLGRVHSFGVLTPAAVGNAAGEPATVLRGDVGAGGAITGFPPGIITGTVHSGPVAIDAAMTDLQAAYTDAFSRPSTGALPASLNGGVFGPGVHSTIAASGTAAQGAFTIDGEGNPDSVFIFQVGGALDLGANTTISLIRGAHAKNVFWAVGGAAGIGAPTQFVGTLIAYAAVSSGVGSTINGRLTSLTGAITMGSTQLYSAPPTVSIDGELAQYTTESSPVISGITSARSPMTVTVTIDDVDHPPVTPASTGAWSFQAPPLANGTHIVVASTVDAVGNIGSYTQTLEVDTNPPAVSIDGGPVAATNDLTPTMSGTTDVAAGELVTVTAVRTTPAATVTRTTIVQSDHTWNVTADLAPGAAGTAEWTITARVHDVAGNANTATQALTVDALSPVASITSSGLTNDPTPTITGTAEPEATVTITVDGLTAVDVAQGPTWSATTTVALGHGSHHVTVTATDAVGNTTMLTQTLIVDLAMPLITINPGPTLAVNDATPTIAGTTDTDIGTTVTVSINGGPPLSALVQADGWNVTPSTGLSAGEHTIVAAVTDPAGNVGTATQTLTLDTADPTVVIDGGASHTTADASPTITGSSPDIPVGSTVTVQVAGQTMTTAIVTGGSYSVTPAAIAPNGTYFVFVTVVDAAGNDGVANQSLTINAVAPTVSFTSGPIASTNDATPLIAGTSNATVGAPVVVTVAGQTLRSLVQPGGSWNVTAAHLGDGEVGVTTSITDTDGNVGSATQSLTVRSSAATMLAFGAGAVDAANDDTPLISGTTDAADGREVTVTVAGQTLTVAAMLGTWSVEAGHIDDGSYTVTASVDASGGQPGSATQSLTIDTVDPTVVIGGGEATVQTGDPTPAISGGGVTPGSTVTVVVAGQTMTTTVAGDGTWSVTAPDPLPAGENAVTVTITDPAGNTGTGNQIVTVIEEPTTITFAGGVSEATNDGTPTISGSTNAANGRTLTVTVGTQTLHVVIADGVWSITAAHLVDGVYNVTATVTATDGTPAAASQSLTVDTAAPVADYTSVGPKRVFDTRAGASPNALRAVTKQPIGGSYEIRVQMTDLAGFVPASGVGAVSLNVTSTRSSVGGYVTVYACGTRETVSSLNFRAARTTANAVIAPVSSSGDVCLYASELTDIIVDINGWWAQGAAFHSVGPKRVFDTRAHSSPTLRDVPSVKLAAGTMLEVQLTDIDGFVPANDVGSVSLNVVVVNPQSSGFVTVYACGTREEVSSVNFVAGQTVANAVIAPVSATGAVCFYSTATADLIADINGWIESGSSFHGLDPARVFDTRANASPNAIRSVPKAKVGGSNVLEVQVTDLAGLVPVSGVIAVSLNVTATNPDASGFITVFACGTMEEVSSLNFAAGQTVANAVIAPVSGAGTICLFSSQPTNVIVDINGWIGTEPVS